MFFIDKSRFVVPLFYHIDPSVVRRQTHKFDEAFEKHQRRFVGQEEKLRNWRLALEGVASLSGIQIPKTRSEVDIITQIVDQILLEINPKTIDVGRYPVGLFSRAEQVIAMLSSVTEGDIANGINGVITIGLHGIRGVGKTALAKTLYNNLFQHFQASCFLANVREVSKRAKGMVSLQEQLLNDVLKCKNTNIDNVYHGVELIRARISFTKVLVVIDDLCNPEHYHLLVGRFPLGSLVIATTRDVEVLDKIEVEPEYRYMVNELDDVESLKLFNLPAFRKPEPDNTLMVLTNHILLLAGGLPLALEVFGSYLYKRSEAEWKHYIKKLQHSIHEKY